MSDADADKTRGACRRPVMKKAPAPAAPSVVSTTTLGGMRSERATMAE